MCASLDQDSEPIELNGKTMIITSPNFPGKYPNNAYKLWSVRTPPGVLIDMYINILDTQRNSDYVYIGDDVCRSSFNNTSWKLLLKNVKNNFRFWGPK